jgi:hypothetical protein
MAARRKAVKVRSTGPGLRERLTGMGQVMWRPAVLWVLPTLALIGICVAGLAWARNEVATSPKYRVVAPKLDLSGLAEDWWEPAFTAEINRRAAFANGASILDDALPEKVAAAYRTCAWVKKVHWVEKRYPHQLRARIDLRMPAAAVKFTSSLGTRYYLVGDDGVRLPKSYATWSGVRPKVPVIEGVNAVPPAAGQVWRETSVVDAIRVITKLESNATVASTFTFASVDVSNYQGRRDRNRSEFTVITANKCKIEWGRAPGSDKPGELSVDEKIAKLERFLKDTDSSTDNQTLALRFPGRMRPE